MTWFTQMVEKWISFPYLEEYLSFVFHPLWLFMLPVLLYSLWLYLYLFGCASSLLLYIYKKKKNHEDDNFYSNFWEKPRQVMVKFLDLVGKILHGYEVIGMEHIPKGPGIIVFHHSIILVGYSLLVMRIYKDKARMCHTVIDRNLYNIPGLKMLFDVLMLKDYKRADCVEILKKGHLLGIAPGGSREAFFSNDYTIMWGHRTGFAQLALEAKVPIIPMFTQNGCEAYRTLGKTKLTKWLYEKTRRVMLPIYGGFPVKVRIYIGEPIPYDPNITPAELAEKTKTALENLRDRHQKRPGNILRAVLERFDKHHKAD